MSEETNKAAVLGVYEVVNSGEIGRLREYVSADVVAHGGLPGEEEIGGGLEAVEGQFRMALSAFPDLRYEVDDVVTEGDKVVLRWTARGTHRGDLMGMPPSGRPIVLAGIHIMRVEDGKVVEHWGQQDSLGMMRQIGALPGPDEEAGAR